MESIRPLIMCGGAGTRLWPVSRDSLPKQFAPLLGSRSSFQEAALRVRGAPFSECPLIVANHAHRYIIEHQLAEIGVTAELLLEPVRRDSGPAIAAGCLVIGRENPDALVLVLAADQMVSDPEAFRQAICAARPAAQAGRLVTFGINPTHPSAEYGYIEPGPRIEGKAHAVGRFAEKPDIRTAAEYIHSGFVWNSGNFLFSARALTEEYHRFAPESAEAVRQACALANSQNGALILQAEALERAEKSSIDYAVMERTLNAAVVKMSCGWSDLGSWEALWALSEQDASGNVTRGDVELLDAKGCYVSTDGPLASVLGVSDLIVVANRDVVLVTRRDRAPEVKQFVSKLRSKGRREADSHLKVFRPWGWYQILDLGDQFQVKRIVVKPTGKLSLQKHRYRAEHWVVVNGRARVTVDHGIRDLGQNEHAQIPLGSVHRLENVGNTPLEIIEVQSGTYLGEDDIERLEDIYCRNLN